MSDDRWNEVGSLIADLYSTVGRLEELFPGRKFTPDGHLVGSIGEVIAAYMFDLKLLPGSAKIHDATAPDGRNVQIKFTQGNRGFAISSEPDYLIALRMTSDREIHVVYDGPGDIAWNAAGRMQKNGQRPLGMSRLRELYRTVDAEQRIPAVAQIALVA